MPDQPSDAVNTPASSYRQHATQLLEEAAQVRFAECRRSLFDIARWYAALATHVERRASPMLSEAPLRRRGE
jgi:hypothetical protein